MGFLSADISNISYLPLICHTPVHTVTLVSIADESDNLAQLSVSRPNWSRVCSLINNRYHSCQATSHSALCIQWKLSPTHP